MCQQRQILNPLLSSAYKQHNKGSLQGEAVDAFRMGPFANSYHFVCISVPKMTMSKMTYLFNIKRRQQGPNENSLLPNSSILNQSSSQKGLRTCGTHCMYPRISWRTAFPFKMRFTSCDIDFNGLATLRPPRLDCSGASNNSNQHSQSVAEDDLTE